VSFIERQSIEDPPVRFPGVKQSAYSIVLEVPKAKSDAFDAFDQVVDGLGWTVADSSEVEVADLVEPVANRAAQLLDLGRH